MRGSSRARMPADPGMTSEQRWFARLSFSYRVLRASGMAFQQLFWDVMGASRGEAFVPIRPQGTRGDGGNDGYLPADGHYFQIYGPVSPEDKVQYTVGKLADDLEKIKKSWDHLTKLKKYSFVFNDKYEGVFSEIGKELARLEKENPGVECRPFCARELEDMFMSLPDDQVFQVLGGVLPDVSSFGQLDYTVMREVIEHIMNSRPTDAETRLGDLPELAEKIQLNNLSEAWAGRIKHGARHTNHVDRVFRAEFDIHEATVARSFG